MTDKITYKMTYKMAYKVTYKITGILILKNRSSTKHWWFGLDGIFGTESVNKSNTERHGMKQPLDRTQSAKLKKGSGQISEDEWTGFVVEPHHGRLAINCSKYAFLRVKLWINLSIILTICSVVTIPDTTWTGTIWSGVMKPCTDCTDCTE